MTGFSRKIIPKSETSFYIWNYILDDNSAKEKKGVMEQYWEKLEYSFNVIKGKMKIMEKVNQYGKYYLDREEI